jgi:tetratricopeptide (TPR) repeat protein
MSRSLYIAVGIIGSSLIVVSGCGPSKPYPAYVPSPKETRRDEFRMAEKEGRVDEAEAGYREMCSATPPFVRACYDLSRLLLEIKRVNDGRKATVEFVTRFSDSGLASVAIKRFSASYRAGGDQEGGVVALQKLESRVQETQIHDSLLYQIAALAGEAGKPETEERSLQRLITQYDRWSSQLWDDSMWRLILLKKEKRDVSAEKKLIKELLNTRERSRFIGSYNSPYYDDAALRLGDILMEKGDYRGAYNAYEDLSEVETSRLRDDALVGLARLMIAQEKTREACRFLDKVQKIRDASAHREAAELAIREECPPPK